MRKNHPYTEPTVDFIRRIEREMEEQIFKDDPDYPEHIKLCDHDVSRLLVIARIVLNLPKEYRNDG